MKDKKNTNAEATRRLIRKLDTEWSYVERDVVSFVPCVRNLFAGEDCAAADWYSQELVDWMSFISTQYETFRKAYHELNDLIQHSKFNDMPTKVLLRKLAEVSMQTKCNPENLFSEILELVTSPYFEKADWTNPAVQQYLEDAYADFNKSVTLSNELKDRVAELTGQLPPRDKKKIEEVKNE
jgi:hypothetical protein